MAPHAGAWGWGAFSAIFIDVVELATIEPGVRADLATQGGSTFTFDWYALIARTRPLEWPPRPSGASSAGVVHRLARTGLGAALLARICYLPRLAGASLPAWRRALCASLLLASQPRQRFALLLRCVHLTLRCGIEHRTLRLRYRHRHFLLRVPFGTRGGGALARCGPCRTC